MADSLIAVDEHTDERKLRELLSIGHECTELDYKETLDFSNPKDKLNFVKDAVAMLNHSPGGFLVIGATDDGSPSSRSSDTDWKQFDPSRLNDIIMKYIGVPIRVVSQTHYLEEGHSYCLICLTRQDDGLPIPFRIDGNYTDQNGKSFKVFSKGEIIRRQNGQNTHLAFADWDEVLAFHDQRVKEQEHQSIDALIGKITEALSGKRALPPLVFGADAEIINEAIDSHYLQGSVRPIQAFALKLAKAIPENEDAFWQLVGIACQAAFYDDAETFIQVVDSIYNYYSDYPYLKGNTAQKLTVAKAIYVIGAALVRTKRWSMIKPLVCKKEPSPYDFALASWLRECQVAASRAALLQDDNGMIIGAALDAYRARSWLAYDLFSTNANRTKDISSEEWAQIEDILTDSLCSFDFLYCVCIFATREGHGDAYPACLYYQAKRYQSVLRELLSADSTMRNSLLPGVGDAAIAAAVKELWSLMKEQSWQIGLFNHGYEGSAIVDSFVEKNLVD